MTGFTPASKEDSLSAEEARRLLRYDEDTGALFWVVRAPGRKVGVEAGAVATTGYRQILVHGRNFTAHRIVWLIAYGVWPADQIDHINGCRQDNRLANLREATATRNAQNERRARVSSQSGLLGVCMRKNGTSTTYFSKIYASGKSHYLGSFATAELAHEAYINAKRRLHEGCTI